MLGNFNYSLTENDSWYGELYSSGLYQLLVNNDQFLSFGYYYNDYPQIGLKIICLNSGYWADQLYQNYYPNLTVQDPAG